MSTGDEANKVTETTEENGRRQAREGFGTRLINLAAELKEINGDLQEIRRTEGGHPVPLMIDTADLSDYSKEVIENFGVNCPAALNEYCCRLEDVFKETTQAQKLLIKDIVRSYEKNDELMQTLFSFQERMNMIKERIDKKDWEGLVDIRQEI